MCVCLGGICIQCGVNVKEARGETAFFDDDKVTRMGTCTKDIREFSRIEIKDQEEPTAENPF